LVTASDFQPVTPKLFVWHAYEPEVKCELSSCALNGPDGLTFIDPIALAAPALGRLLHGRRPCAIILTNANHARAAEQLRASLRIPVFASVEAEGLDIVPDVTLTDRQSAPGGRQVVALPGAGSGEIALVGSDVACIGDALINLAPEGFRTLPEKYCEDAGQLRRSLRKLLSYEFQLMTFAHGVPLIGGARQQLAQLLA